MSGDDRIKLAKLTAKLSDGKSYLNGNIKSGKYGPEVNIYMSVDEEWYHPASITLRSKSGKEVTVEFPRFGLKAKFERQDKLPPPFRTQAYKAAEQDSEDQF